MTIIINGKSGDDNLGGGAYLEDIIINGYAGNDTLSGNTFSGGRLLSSALYGGAGDDVLNSGVGDDVLNGGSGNDTLGAGLESDLLIGRGGIDTFDAHFSGADWVIDLKTGLATTSDAPGEVDTLRGIEVIQTGGGSDSIAGTQRAETIDGGYWGNDTLNGRGGDDYLLGGRWADLLMGSAGNDTLIDGLFDSANDTLRGGTGNDSLNGGGGADLLVGGGGNDTLNDGHSYDDVLNGGRGFDFADYSDSSVFVDLAAGTAWRPGTGENDTLISIEGILAGAGNDTIAGKFTANRFVGGGGNDSLGGAGGNDTLFGGVGMDTLDGGGRADKLFGNNGRDMLDGGAGRDILVGGRGRDILTGDGGGDRFDYNSIADSGVGVSARDQITDFTPGVDRIDVRGIDAIAGGSDNAFTFIGNSSFPGGGDAGKLRYFQNASATVVEGDVNGDGAADFQIALNGHLVLTDGDFFL